MRIYLFILGLLVLLYSPALIAQEQDVPEMEPYTFFTGGPKFEGRLPTETYQFDRPVEWIPLRIAEQIYFHNVDPETMGAVITSNFNYMTIITDGSLYLSQDELKPVNTLDDVVEIISQILPVEFPAPELFKLANGASSALSFGLFSQDVVKLNTLYLAVEYEQGHFLVWLLISGEMDVESLRALAIHSATSLKFGAEVPLEQIVIKNEYSFDASFAVEVLENNILYTLSYANEGYEFVTYSITDGHELARSTLSDMHTSVFDLVVEDSDIWIIGVNPDEEDDASCCRNSSYTVQYLSSELEAISSFEVVSDIHPPIAIGPDRKLYLLRAKHTETDLTEIWLEIRSSDGSLLEEKILFYEDDMQLGYNTNFAPDGKFYVVKEGLNFEVKIFTPQGNPAGEPITNQQIDLDNILRFEVMADQSIFITLYEGQLVHIDASGNVIGNFIADLVDAKYWGSFFSMLSNGNILMVTSEREQTHISELQIIPPAP